MKKLITILVVLMITATCVFAAEDNKKTEKNVIEIQYQTKDNFLLKAKLSLPTDKRSKYPMVVMLHSLGYSSDYWMNLPTKFRQAGFAVLEIDLRGHGKSIYDADFKKINWFYLSNKSFKKYPRDVLSMLVYVNQNYKNVSVSNLTFVGADIGANTAILAASQLKNKPAAMVLISPSVQFKGLYTPIALTDVPCPLLIMFSQKDDYSKKEAATLIKFAQKEYDIKSYPEGGPGMLMLKVNPGMDNDIVNWVVLKFNKSASMTLPKPKTPVKPAPAKPSPKAKAKTKK